MIRIKNPLLGCALSVALSASPAMAADFHALAGLRGTTPAPLDDVVLAATEGGTVCTATVGLISVTADSGAAGGICLVGILTTPAGVLSIVAFANAFPSSAVNFVQFSL
ncbi:MAG: hypothetical protein ACREXR_18550 [Gammaproteobacteria bacterium]